MHLVYIYITLDISSVPYIWAGMTFLPNRVKCNKEKFWEDNHRHHHHHHQHSIFPFFGGREAFFPSSVFFFFDE